MSGRQHKKRKRQQPEGPTSPPTHIRMNLNPPTSELEPALEGELHGPEGHTNWKPEVKKPDPFDVALGSLIVALMVAVVYFFQLRAMIESNRINRDALQSVQRAFVLPGEVDPTVIGSKEPQSIRFNFRWSNSGVTPAKGIAHVNFRWDRSPLPNDFGFPDQWGEGQPHINTPFVIGPKGTVGLQVGPVPAQVIDAMIPQPPLLHLNFWGWAKYWDLFKIEHLTEFCSELITIDAKVDTTPGTKTVTYRLDNCSAHNCYDHDCADYQSRMAEKPM